MSPTKNYERYYNLTHSINYYYNSLKKKVKGARYFIKKSNIYM